MISNKFAERGSVCHPSVGSTEIKKVEDQGVRKERGMYKTIFSLNPNFYRITT